MKAATGQVGFIYITYTEEVKSTVLSPVLYGLCMGMACLTACVSCAIRLVHIETRLCL